MKILIVFDHPYGADASENVPHHRSYTAALTAAAVRGLTGAGHEVDLIDLAADGFNPVMSKDDLIAWRLKSIVDPQAADYQRRLMAADHLVFAFPIWWESMPAGTKGFLDKVLTKGIVYKEPEKPGLFINGIKNIQSVSLITVMSTPGFLYRWIIGNPLLKIMFRGTFRKIGVRKLRWFSAVDPAAKTAEARQRLLVQTEQRFARLL
jgi:NAD(P)H dehydrogenase (quinone)